MSHRTGYFSTAPVIRHSAATPLTNILLNTQIAFDHLKQTGEHGSALYLQRALLNAQHLQHILRLADAATPEAFSPLAALEEIFTLNEGLPVEKQLIKRLTVSPQANLRGSKLLFQEMAVCLLNNALESYAAKQTEKLVFFSALEEAKTLTLSVTDSGRGMNWLNKKLSTVQFYSGKQNHSGLGLHFVKRTVEQEFSGSLQLISKPKRGTTAVLSFPLVSDRQVAKTPSGLQY